MERKKVTILLIFILMFFTFIKPTYAANEVSISLKPKSATLKKGDETAITVSITNSGAEEEILDSTAELEFDGNVFEVVTLDVEELEEDDQQLLEEYQDIIGLLDILCIKDKWLIGGYGDSDAYLITIIYLEENGGIKEGETKEVGEIKFKVLDSANSGNTSIKLTEGEANGEITLADTTLPLSIVGSTSTTREEESGYEQIKNEEKSNKAKENLVYTGVEDVVPFIGVLIVIALISCVNYRKYKDI